MDIISSTSGKTSVLVLNDGSKVELPENMRFLREAITRLYIVGNGRGKRLNEIDSVEELTSAVVEWTYFQRTKYSELAEYYSQLAEKAPGIVKSLLSQNC